MAILLSLIDLDLGVGEEQSDTVCVAILAGDVKGRAASILGLIDLDLGVGEEQSDTVCVVILAGD